MITVYEAIKTCMTCDFYHKPNKQCRCLKNIMEDWARTSRGALVVPNQSFNCNHHKNTPYGLSNYYQNKFLSQMSKI